MRTYLKTPDANRLQQIDAMLQAWAKPGAVASALGLELSTVYRYAEYMDYKRVYLKPDEIKLIQQYRASKQTPTAA